MVIWVKILIVVIALLHLYFLWLEMFVWNTKAKKVIRSLPEDLFEKTKVLAANQGLYNGFLTAGLIWSVIIVDEIWSKNIAFFFLICVVVAGCYGSYSTQSKKIFYVQALPAIIALISLLF